MINWLISNFYEIVATILGFVYIIYSIRQNILLWPVGLLSSLFFIMVFFKSRLYANMVLQAYYVIMSVYGWYYWKKGKVNEDGQSEELPVINMSLDCYSNNFCWDIGTDLYYVFVRVCSFSNSFLGCAATTTLSIVATWMLARKYLENWTLWIITDAISTGLYLKMQLYATSFLYIGYTILAIIGYLEWKKSLKVL